jgi:hypothetical protein
MTRTNSRPVPVAACEGGPVIVGTPPAPLLTAQVEPERPWDYDDGWCAAGGVGITPGWRRRMSPRSNGWRRRNEPRPAVSARSWPDESKPATSQGWDSRCRTPPPAGWHGRRPTRGLRGRRWRSACAEFDVHEAAQDAGTKPATSWTQACCTTWTPTFTSWAPRLHDRRRLWPSWAHLPGDGRGRRRSGNASETSSPAPSTAPTACALACVKVRAARKGASS